MTRPHDGVSHTYAACLTPAGKGAIACLGVAGPDAWRIAAAVFRPAKGNSLPTTPSPQSLTLGKFGAGEAVDDGILFVREVDPNSTTVDLEIHCHGGTLAVESALRQLAAAGAQVVAQEQWLQRRQPPYQNKAQQILTRCLTARTAAIALDQFHGAWARAEHDIAALALAGQADEAQRRRDRLRSLALLGRHLDTPWNVVLAGAPNVGKSSLVNALAGFTRSIVASTPGTTRDVVTTIIALDGWPIQLTDTAGLRDAAERLEAAGIDRARAALSAADLLIWVLDGSAPLVQPPSDVCPDLVVVNKRDLPRAWALKPAMLGVSARTGEGLDELVREIVAFLVPEPPLPGEAVPLT